MGIRGTSGVDEKYCEDGKRGGCLVFALEHNDKKAVRALSTLS